MERNILEEKLKKGLSLRQIARETSKGLTTIRYWVKKYELIVNIKNKEVKKCNFCDKELKGRNKKYCNNKCQVSYQKNEIFEEIKNGNLELNDRWYKKYLIEEYGEKCMKCNWNEVNQVTKKVPIELEHKDGNSKNNHLDNLELLCPNCHSLTSTYKGLNRGNGRNKRMERYYNGKTF